jgi:hypothetical protein
MKLLRTSLARAIWLVDPEVINAGGRSFWEFYHALAKRYHFSKFPQHLMDFNSNNALEFTAGTFVKTKRLQLRVGLAFYNNGVMADTLSSTDDADHFLTDIFQWAAREFDIFTDSGQVRKSYVSQVDVKFDSAVKFANPKLDFVADRLNSEAAPFGAKRVPFGLGGLELWTEDIHMPQGQVFKLEHKHETEFTENIYYSVAPLQTQQHMALLEDIEKALKG